MKFAKLIKLGGELIEAAKADYDDYRGFLICPECGEPVFLRKHHKRGNVEIPDAFIHHKLSESTALCEARVNSYKIERIKGLASKAREQRLRKLQVSLWKYLKMNLSINLSQWSQHVRFAKETKILKEVVEYGEELTTYLSDFICNYGLEKTSKLIIEKDISTIFEIVDPRREKIINDFLNSRKRDWELHCKITSEALELFINSKSMKEIRFRLLACLCNPKILDEAYPELLDLDMATDEWKDKFKSYLSASIIFLFLMIDWIEIFKE